MAAPALTLEAGFDAGSRTTVDLDSPFNLPFLLPGLPLDMESSSRFTTATTLVGFHQQATPRLALGYRAGFSFVRATYRTNVPDIALPTPVFTGDLPFAIVDFPLQFGRRTLTSSQNSGALALGFEAAIKVAARIAVVPEVRAMAFSSPGPGVFLIRPGAGVRWSF